MVQRQECSWVSEENCVHNDLGLTETWETKGSDVNPGNRCKDRKKKKALFFPFAVAFHSF